MGSLRLKRTFDIVHIVLKDNFSDFNSTQLLSMVSTQLRHKWNALAVLDPSTRISLSVIEFTAVETQGGEPWKLQGWLPLPDFQTI